VGRGSVSVRHTSAASQGSLSVAIPLDPPLQSNDGLVGRIENALCRDISNPSAGYGAALLVRIFGSCLKRLHCFGSVQAVAIHANMKINFGPLRYVFATPQFHHCHHSKDRQYMDANYAVHLPLIDMLFGIYKCPKGEWPAEYGIVSGEPPAGFWKQVLHPFRSPRE